MRGAVLGLLILLSGCGIFQAQKANWDACKADPACYEDAKKWQETGEVVGGLVGSVVPGAAMPAQKIFGYLALGLAMLLGGHVLNKKKITNG